MSMSFIRVITSLYISCVVVVLPLVPVVTLASDYLGGDAGLDGLFRSFNGFINNILIPFVFTVALLVFIYGMYLYFIQKGASDDEREKGRQLALYSIVGFVLMVSIWAIVNLISIGLFGTNSGTIPDAPVAPGYTP